MSRQLVIVALMLAGVAARADGPQDNIPSQVRPVPPPGMPLAEADRRTLERELSALAQQIKPLKAKPELAPFVPDVEIFYRAAATAFQYGEIFAADEVMKARRLIATGRDRATFLSRGQTPWLERPGTTALGYVSALDGSVQPYGLYLPPGWTPDRTRRWRLDTWFHGRAEKLSEVNFIEGVMKNPGQFPRPDAITVQPYGRYCNGSKFAGEVDFFEALADIQRRFSIDEDRIVIRGFSLGGASAWHLAAHHAWRWAAVAPGAGFSETADFLKVFQNEKLEPAWWEQALWQLYDAPPYAANFRNVPLVAYSGALDKQKQAADVMAKALQGAGIEMVHVIGPQTAHKYHPDAKVKIDRLVDALAAQGRDPLPRRVSLTTPTLRYNRQAWLQADGITEHWTPARLDGELVGDHEVRLTTKNVTALTVLMEVGQAPFFPGKPPAVVIDGQRLAGTAPDSDRSWRASFHKQGSRWLAGAAPADGLRKRHGLQGPIDDAFMSSFLMVTPSGRPIAPKVAPWVYDEQMRAIKEWRRHFRGEPRVKLDIYVSADDIANHNLVLWGDPGSNRLLASVAQQLPIAWSAQAVTVGKTEHAADKHALIAVYPNPFNPSKYVVINSGFTFGEYDYLNNARQTPKLPDWAVVDTSVKPNSRAPGKIVDAGFFDERWGLKPGPKAKPTPSPPPPTNGKVSLNAR